MERNRNGGFTLLETVLTVAILVILLGVSAVGVAYYKDYLKVTELDNIARDIYMAAENRAVLLENSGASAELLSSRSQEEVTLPDGNKVTRPDGSKVFVHILSNQPNPDDLAELLPTGTIDPALWKGNFYVLYDAFSHHVTEVFYAKETFTTAELTNFRKTRGERVTDFRGGTTTQLVGYYGISLGDPIATKPLPTPAWRFPS